MTKAEPIMTVEKTFTLKMEILLTQRILSIANSNRNNIERVYDRLQQENAKLHEQVQDLTKELQSMVAATFFLSAWTPVTTPPPFQ